MSRPLHVTPEAAALEAAAHASEAAAHAPETSAHEYPELLEPTTRSWPVLESSLDRASRLPSPRVGRWVQGLLVKMALFWLSASLGLVVVRMACDDFAKSRRRA